MKGPLWATYPADKLPMDMLAVARFLLPLPCSSAGVERQFSRLKAVTADKARNRLGSAKRAKVLFVETALELEDDVVDSDA